MDAAEVSVPTSPKSKKQTLTPQQKKLFTSVVALIAIMIVFAFMTDGVFFEARNLSNLLRQTALNGILAVGMTWVILLAGIDLSIGSVVAAIGIVVAIGQTQWGWAQMGWGGVALTFGVATLLGVAVGLFNGIWVATLGIHPFVTTFGMMVIARGIAMIMSDGQSISPMGTELNELGAGYLSTPTTAVILFGLGGLWAAFTVMEEVWARRAGMGGSWAWVGTKVALVLAACVVAFVVFNAYSGLPIPVLIFAVIAFLGSWILNRTRFGRYIYAVGGNPEAARLAGIPVKAVILSVFTVMGALSAWAAVILTARLNGATPTAGQLFELDAIAAVVIGGTSLMGGRGSVAGSIIGALIISSLNNGMSLMNVPTFYQMPLKGAIVIMAVALDAVIEKKR